MRFITGIVFVKIHNQVQYITLGFNNKRYIWHLKLLLLIPQSLKMKRINLFCTALFAVASFTANAQINQTPVHSSGNQIYVQGEKALPATGSMFISEQYLPAKASNNNGTTLLLRYNAYSDLFEVSNPQEQSVKVLPKQPNVIVTFSQNNESYVYETYKTEKGETVTGYLNIISDNPKVKIYKRERIYLQQGSVPANSYQTAKAPAYKKAADEYYVKVADGEATFFDDKKDYAKLIPGKSKEVLEFIKTNKINVENATDLQKLAEYSASVL